jgi:hypothetical protein
MRESHLGRYGYGEERLPGGCLSGAGLEQKDRRPGGFSVKETSMLLIS